MDTCLTDEADRDDEETAGDSEDGEEEEGEVVNIGAGSGQRSRYACSRSSSDICAVRELQRLHQLSISSRDDAHRHRARPHHKPYRKHHLRRQPHLYRSTRRSVSADCGLHELAGNRSYPHHPHRPRRQPYYYDDDDEPETLSTSLPSCPLISPEYGQRGSTVGLAPSPGSRHCSLPLYPPSPLIGADLATKGAWLTPDTPTPSPAASSALVRLERRSPAYAMTRHFAASPDSETYLLLTEMAKRRFEVVDSATSGTDDSVTSDTFTSRGSTPTQYSASTATVVDDAYSTLRTCMTGVSTTLGSMTLGSMTLGSTAGNNGLGASSSSIVTQRYVKS